MRPASSAVLDDCALWRAHDATAVSMCSRGRTRCLRACWEAAFLALLLVAAVAEASAGLYIVQLKVMAPGASCRLPPQLAFAGSQDLSPIHMQGDPAVLRLPQNYKLSVSGNQRVAAVSTAARAVQAEQSEFKAAASKISFETQFTYQQVCPVCSSLRKQ